MVLYSVDHGARKRMRNGPLIISHGALSGVRHKGNDLDSQNSTA